MKLCFKKHLFIPLCIILTSCSAVTGSNSIPSASAPRALIPEDQSAPASLKYEYCGGLYSSNSSTKNGFYDLLIHGDGTGNLVYYDYATMQCVYLSNQPNSDHQDESDTSFVPSVVGGAVAVTDSNHLYVLKSTYSFSGATDKTLREGFLMRMELNGQDRISISLPSDTYLAYASGAATAGDKMLILLQEVLPDTSEVNYLAEVDFRMGSIKRCLEFEKDETAFLIGVCSQGPVFAINNHTLRQQRLYIYDSGENVLSQIPFDADANPYILEPTTGIIYYLSEGEIFRYDVTTQQTESTAYTIPGGNWTQVDLTSLVDGHLSISLSDSENDDYESYTLCLATGEVFHPNLEDMDRPVIISAVTPDRYLVKLGGIPIKYQDYTPDGVPFENEAIIRHFAMMSKEDYWNNQPNYQEFDNLAYENYSLVQ